MPSPGQFLLTSASGQSAGGKVCSGSWSLPVHLLIAERGRRHAHRPPCGLGEITVRGGPMRLTLTSGSPGVPAVTLLCSIYMTEYEKRGSQWRVSHLDVSGNSAAINHSVTSHCASVKTAVSGNLRHEAFPHVTVKLKPGRSE